LQPIVPNSATKSNAVQVLLGVFNGSAFLHEQLASIYSQHNIGVSLTCSDDGSTDNSRDIIARWAENHPTTISQKSGPRQGFSRNYMQMISDLPVDAGYVALADQDDIWMDWKLNAATAALSLVPSQTPALYCSQRMLWWPKTNTKLLDRPVNRPPSFQNALIENIASGNTIVLNPAAARIARAAARVCGPVFAHDWWLYLLISGAGGRIIYDDNASLLYRQHGGNAVGGGHGLRSQIKRKLCAARGEWHDRLSMNMDALQKMSDFLTPESIECFRAFDRARRAWAPKRIYTLNRVGVYRQTRGATISFWGAAAVGRI
jgi:glycosyltransferase involved in cell wall biosynthesis